MSGNLFCITDQRGDRHYIAAPSLEAACAWLREQTPASLIQYPEPVRVETMGRLAIMLDADGKEHEPPRPVVPKEKSNRD